MNVTGLTWLIKQRKIAYKRTNANQQILVTIISFCMLYTKGNNGDHFLFYQRIMQNPSKTILKIWQKIWEDTSNKSRFTHMVIPKV